MSNSFKSNRRDMLKLLAALGASVAGERLIGAPCSSPTKRRRHLINIQSFGGSDAAWHWSPTLVNENTGLDPTSYYGVAAARYPDSAALPFSGGFIGPALNGYSATDLNRLAVWRGVAVEGGHGIGNIMNENGHLSAYAAAFSVIIADTLAQAPDYIRPLHYVMMMPDPAAYSSQPGFYTGIALPTCIPDFLAWTNLSKLNGNDPANSATLKLALDDVVAALSGGKNLKLPASQSLMTDSFLPSFNSSQSILGKNYAASPVFTAIMARYLKDLTDDFVAYFLTNPHLVAAFTGYPGFPTDASSAATFVNNRYGASLYPFAVAEFLVKNDLSAVVDIPTRGADYHFTNHLDLFDAFFTWTCHKSLMRALAATPIADGCGESLLDRTLVVHSTEFDRSMSRGLESPAGGLTIGANHGPTATYVLGGYRVNGGNMFGHRMTTPTGSLGSITGSDLYFAGPVPLDPQTGQPSSSGVMYSQRALAPTVLSLFGATIPSQQVTEQKAAGFIEKKASGY